MAKSSQLSAEEVYKQALLKARSTIQKLLIENETLKRKEAIAVVGMACRFPGGGNSPEAFWTMLQDGRDAITDVPLGRWDAEALYAADLHTAGKMYTIRGGFLNTPVDCFDASFFGIAPREARALDPQHRLLLEIGWEALEHACLDPTSLKDTKTGVFVGMSSDDYAQMHRHSGQPERIDAYSIMGTTFSTAVGRLSYALGLQGPCMALDTACSSSLVALHLACQSLRSGESDLALTGGVNLILTPASHICFSKLQAISPDGKCKTFDASANGYVRGEGCGLVVLKRLQDALRDGNRILGVIRGTAVNQDGKTNGLAAPNGHAQQAVIRQALQAAGLHANDVDYVETHGTGTVLGDPIEVEALGAVFGPGRQEPLRLGAVKTNIGHLEPAAGVAGLIKVILSLLHEELPPNLHFQRPNPYIPWERMPVQVVSERSTWKRSSRKRVAGLSAFGFSGTNAHVIIEEAPVPKPLSAHQATPPADAYLLNMSARDEHALRALAADYLTRLSPPDAGSSIPLDDICYSASLGRRHWPARLAVVGSDRADMYDKLADFLDSGQKRHLVVGMSEEERPPKIAFLFTGQGSPYPGMGRGLYDSQVVFRDAIDRCDRLLQSILSTPLPISLVDLLWSAPAEMLHQTVYAQPALFALEYALAQQWAAWGIRPSVVMGHSVGEYAAACVAGVFSLEDGLRLVAERGRLMQALPSGGGMAAVFAAHERVATALEPYAGQATIAAFNGPEHVVISGEEKAVQSVCAALEHDGVRTATLAVSHAFHSHLMEPMLAEFERVARQVAFSPPQTTLISNITGQAIGVEAGSAAYWLRHIRQPVAFEAGMHTLQQQGVNAFVELGPQQTLLGMGRRCLAARENGDAAEAGLWLPSLRQQTPDLQQIYVALAALYVASANVDWSGVYADRAYDWVSLPSYPFQRQRFWADSPVSSASAQQSPSPLSPRLAHPLLHHMVRSPVLESILFETRFDTAALPLLEDHRVFGKVVVSGACLTSMLLGAARQALSEGMVRLSDVVLHHPLVIPDGGEQRVHLGIKPEGDGHGSFRVVSLAADTGAASVAETETLHVSGHVRVDPQPSQASPPVAPASLEVWNAFDVQSDTHSIKGEDVYAAHRRHHIEWGLSNRWIDAIRVNGAEAMARLHLPQHDEGDVVAVDGYHLHPGLIDSCFSLLLAIAGLETQETLLPFALEQFSLMRPATGRQFWAYSRRVLPESSDKLVGDVWLMDEQGELIAECLGLQGRMATAEHILQNLQNLPSLLQRQQDLHQWFYHIEWRKSRYQEQPITAVQPLEQWLIFMDEQGYGAELTQRLQARGHRTIAVMLGGRFEHVGPDRYRIDPLSAADMQLLAEAVFDTADAHSRIVYLWGLDAHSDDAAALEAAIARSCAPILHCVQALSRLKQAVSIALTLVTKGGQTIGSPASTPESVQICQAPLWGLGKTIALEYPELHCRLIELDPQTAAEGSDLFIQELLFPDRENQIALRGDERLIPRLVRYPLFESTPSPQAFPVREDGHYLICGGLGALGQRFAQDIVSRGGRYLTLCGRSPAGPEAQALISELEQLGATIQVCQADITQYDEIQTVIQAASAERPLMGIVHAAGVLDDGILNRLEWTRFSQVLAAKTVGLYHLHALSQSLDLDFFIACSSMVSLLGSPAQASYVAANTFVDALMQARRHQGLPGLSVNWGPWAEGGMAARLDSQQRSRLLRHGVNALSSADAFRALERLWPEPPAQVGIMDIQWPEFLRHFPGAMDMPLVESFVSDLVPSDRQASALAESYVLGVPPGGSLEALRWQPAERRAPEAGEVEIQVQTAGLNFKDVLLALHMLPATGPILGVECAGEVVRVGAGVTHLAVGASVLAMAPGSFGRYVTVPARMVASLPDGLSFAAAATLPLAFLTVAYALEELAHLQPGERVLIHAAAGGVGQAAIQLAQRVGAEIFATASEGKWEVLRALGVKHIMNSRTLEFAEEIRQLTHGEGVDVILNSLRGEFTTQSLTLLKPGGRFLEIGLTDIRSADDVAKLAPGASYHTIDLTELYQTGAEVLPRLLARILKAYEAGELQPLNHRVFPVNEAVEAFRFMQQAKHTGKLVLSFAEPPASLQSASPANGKAKWIEQLEQTPIARRRTVLTSLVRAEIGLVLGAGADQPIALRQRLFDLGIDSLMAVELKNRASSALGCPLGATVLFDYPTLEALIEHLCAMISNVAFEDPEITGPVPVGPPSSDNTSADLSEKEAALDQLSQQELENMLAEKLSITAE